MGECYMVRDTTIYDTELRSDVATCTTADDAEHLCRMLNMLWQSRQSHMALIYAIEQIERWMRRRTSTGIELTIERTYEDRRRRLVTAEWFEERISAGGRIEPSLIALLLALPTAIREEEATDA